MNLTLQSVRNHYRENETLLMAYAVTCARKVMYKNSKKYNSNDFSHRYTYDKLRTQEKVFRDKLIKEGLSIQSIRKVMSLVELDLKKINQSKSEIKFSKISKSPILADLYDLFVDTINEIPDEKLYIKTQEIPEDKIREYEIKQGKNRYIQMKSPRQRERKRNTEQKHKEIKAQQEHIHQEVQKVYKKWLATNPPMFEIDDDNLKLKRFRIETEYVTDCLKEMFAKYPETEKMYYENDDFADEVIHKFQSRIRQKMIDDYNRYHSRYK